MVLGFHCWVYCQMEFRKQGWSDRDRVYGTVARDQLGTICADGAAAGFDAIETMADLLLADGGLSAHQEALPASGLDFLGVSHNAAFWDPAQQQSIVDFLASAAERVQQLGGTHLGLSALEVPGPKTAEHYDQQAECLRAVAAAVRPFGVTANLHTYSRDAANDYAEIREMIARLEVTDLELGPDLAWLAHGGGSAVECIERFGEWMTFCHLRDFRADNTWAEAAGDGVEDFAAIGAAFRAVGYRGPAVYEPAYAEDQPTRSMPENLRRSAAWLRQELTP